MSVIAEARQRRHEEYRRKCKNDKQRAVFDRLYEDDVQAYVADIQGKTVVRQFKQYSHTADPNKIENGLYHWSIYDGPGDIAHFNLHGFRSVYNHPALYYELLLMPWLKQQKACGWRLPSVYVYTDGMTSHDVRDEIMRVAVECRHRVMETFGNKKRAEELAEAQELAARWGMKLVPDDS